MHTQQEMRYLRWKPARLTEVRSTPPNPWRGLYAIYPFLITGNEAQERYPVLNAEHSLCMAEFNLHPFREGKLSDEALAQIDRILGWFRDRKRELIVRFLYDLEGNGLQNEPQSITVILGHMQQLSPLLLRYETTIFTLQGLFVGSWGEMHGSRHLGPQSLIALTQALDEAAERRLLLAVRCPNQWREIFQTYDPPLQEHMFDGQRHSRVGLFNDAILASETDFGTYGEADRAQAASYGTKQNRENELAFQNRLCIGVPNGGELVYGEGGFELSATYRAFRLMRLSYLNAEFDSVAFDRLRGKANIARGWIWRGTSAYDYLMEHLGYRFVLRKTCLKHTDDGINLRVQLENTGFAACYFPLQAQLLVRTAQGALAASAPIAGDSRTWQPGRKVWLDARLKTLPLPDGRYTLDFSLGDPRSGKPVYLAGAERGGQPRETLTLGTLQFLGGHRNPKLI